MTHHVTSYLLVATLEVITLGALLARDRRLVAWASILALVSAAAFGAWIVFVAPSTVGYLQPVIDGALQSLRALLAGGHSGVPPPASAANGPLENQALSAVAVLIMSVLVPVGWWQVWRRYRHQPWLVALAIGAVSWYVIVAVRLFVANGSELAGRASTFVFLPAGFIAALAVIRLTDNSLRWPVIRAERAAAGTCRGRRHGGGRAGAGAQRAGQRLAAVLGAAAGAIPGRRGRTIGGSRAGRLGRLGASGARAG